MLSGLTLLTRANTKIELRSSILGEFAMRRAIWTVFFVIGLIVPAFAQQSFTADFSWGSTPRCDGTKSPPFTLSNVPPGTTTIRFRMTDQEVPSYPHGGGDVAYTGQSEVPEGAFSYYGPCPRGGSHTYDWSIEALDQGGNRLATTRASKKFPL